MDPDIINSVGLSLDIGGVAPLLLFGLPSGVEHPDAGDAFRLGSPVSR